MAKSFTTHSSLTPDSPISTRNRRQMVRSVPISVKLCLLLVFVLSCFDFSRSSPSMVAAATTTVTCPLSFDHVVRIPWNTTDCRNLEKSADRKNSCCQSALSLIGISMAKRLKQASRFRLPDLATSVSCLRDFQEKLDSLSLPTNLTSTCFDPSQFVISPDTDCAGIETTRDWVSQLGDSTPLDSACSGDLTDLTRCDACVAAGFRVQSRLLALDGNSSHATDCYHFAVVYAAGIVNNLGPESDGALTCIFSLSLSSSVGSKGKSHKALILGTAGAAVVTVLVISGFVSVYLWYGRSIQRRRREIVSEEQGLRPRFRPNTGSIWFKIEALDKATNGFSQKNFVGRGGYGYVYKGILPDGSLVAVKKVTESEFQGDAEFRNEVEIISNLKHRNLVPLRGCSMVDDDEIYGTGRYLVYDYMPNGNLDDHLFPSGTQKKLLDWPQRKSIVLDVAKGLAYLHHGVKPAIYHRDIKGTNILLDGEMRARVADFGLAKQSREGQSHLTTRVAGTHGYLAPEYALYGQLTEKSDVYSFGIVVLEVMCGRKALDLSADGRSPPQAFLITDWAWSLVKSGRIDEALDPRLATGDDDDGGGGAGGAGGGGSSNVKAVMERFLRVGILCAHVLVAFRPTISEALKMLEGDIGVPQIPDRPVPLSHPSFRQEDGSELSSVQMHSADMLR